MYNVTKDSIYKRCSFELSFHQRIMKKSLYKTVFKIYNKNECFLNIKSD